MVPSVLTPGMNVASAPCGPMVPQVAPCKEGTLRSTDSVGWSFSSVGVFATCSGIGSAIAATCSVQINAIAKGAQRIANSCFLKDVFNFPPLLAGGRVLTTLLRGDRRQIVSKWVLYERNVFAFQLILLPGSIHIYRKNPRRPLVSG